MADEKRAGPWEVRGSTYVRMGPDGTALVWAWQGEGVWEWARLPAGERGAANTATRALWAADDVLVREGWVLEPTRVPPGVVRVSHGTVDPPEPPPAPVVAIIRRWAADRDAGRDVGEGAEVLLDELLEAVGTGRPADGPLVWMREPAAGGALGPPSVAIVSPGGGGVSPNALPVAPPVTEARGRLVAGAWVERANGDWVRSSPDPFRDAARVWEARAWGEAPVEWWWRWEASGAGDEMPTPEAARQAADTALRAAGWELQ